MRLGLQRALPKKVWNIARSVRRKIIETNGSSFGSCWSAAWLLHSRLIQAGFLCRICAGGFHTGWNGYGHQGHCWVRFNRAILDITADQFNNDIEDNSDGSRTKMAAIVYGINAELERRYKE